MDALLQELLKYPNLGQIIQELQQAWQDEQTRRHEFWAKIDEGTKADLFWGKLFITHLFMGSIGWFPLKLLEN